MTAVTFKENVGRGLGKTQKRVDGMRIQATRTIQKFRSLSEEKKDGDQMTTIGSGNAPNLPEMRMTAQGKTTFPEDGTASAPAGSQNADSLPAKTKRRKGESTNLLPFGVF